LTGRFIGPKGRGWGEGGGLRPDVPSG